MNTQTSKGSDTGTQKSEVALTRRQEDIVKGRGEKRGELEIKGSVRPAEGGGSRGKVNMRAERLSYPWMEERRKRLDSVLG